MYLLFSFLLWSATAVPTAAPKDIPTENPAQVDSIDAANNNQPPPSSWDKQRKQQGGQENNEELSFMAQMGRTLFALLVVVGLIYLFGKLAMGKLGAFIGIKAANRGGKHVRVVERIQLDAKNALFLIDIDNDVRLLIGGNDGGMRVLRTIDQTRETPSFASTLEGMRPDAKK